MKVYTQEQLNNITEAIKSTYPIIISQIKKRIEFRSMGEDVKAFVAEYVRDYVKYNQGSLSFTETALRHAGRNPHLGILEIIESEINKN